MGLAQDVRRLGAQRLDHGVLVQGRRGRSPRRGVHLGPQPGRLGLQFAGSLLPRPLALSGRPQPGRDLLEMGDDLSRVVAPDPVAEVAPDDIVVGRRPRVVSHEKSSLRPGFAFGTDPAQGCRRNSCIRRNCSTTWRRRSWSSAASRGCMAMAANSSSAWGLNGLAR